MSRPIIVMSPGQGVQYPGMGSALYASDDSFRSEFDQALKPIDRGLADRIRALIRQPNQMDEQVLEDCRVTHPFVFVIHYALARRVELEGIRATHILGYSLGEFLASVLSGHLSVEEGLQLAVETGRWVHEHTPERRMMAILANPEIRSDYYPFLEGVKLACYNYPEHFVVTGRKEELELIANEVAADGYHYEMLPIRRGFHAAEMDPFLREAATWPASPVKALPRDPLPQYSCALGRSLTVADIRDNHWGKVHRLPVQFEATFQKIDAELQPRYLDLSVSGTLAAFARKLIPRNRYSDIYSLQSRLGDGITQFQRFLSRWRNDEDAESARQHKTPAEPSGKD